MHLLLRQLRSELEHTNIKMNERLDQELIRYDLNIPFTFNGFSTNNAYKLHLRQFYDHFKLDVEQTLNDQPDKEGRQVFLESIQLQLIESEKLDCVMNSDEYDLENCFNDFMDVRMEANTKYHFSKK